LDPRKSSEIYATCIQTGNLEVIKFLIEELKYVYDTNDILKTFQDIYCKYSTGHVDTTYDGGFGENLRECVCYFQELD